MARLLYTTADDSPQSGAFRCMLGMARAASELGHEVHLVVTREASEGSLVEQAGDVAVHTEELQALSRSRAGQIGLFGHLREIGAAGRRFRTVVDRVRPDLLVVNELIDLYGWLRPAGAPVMLHARFGGSGFQQTVLSSLARRRARHIVVPSASVQRRLFPDVPQVSVLHDAAPGPSPALQPEERRAIRAELGAGDDPVIALVAKLTEEKGHDLLIDAIGRLEGHPDVQAWLVGGRLDGEHHRRYAAELERAVEQRGLSDRIRFLGFRSDAFELMQAADIVLNASRFPDPLPGVVLEGLRAGRPVVAPRIGGCPEMIEDGRNGRLFTPDDSTDLARVLGEVLESPAEERAAWAAAGAETLASRFSHEEMRARLGDLLDRLLPGARPGGAA